MENQIPPESYEEIKENAKKFYKNVESVWCPALKDDVVFKDDGFKHLIWSKRWRRSKKEQVKRLSLLKQAPEIIKHAEKWNEYRIEERDAKAKWQGEKIKISKHTHFWAFDGKIQDVTIRVVIRQIGKGKKHFLSVFARDENVENKKRLTG